MANYTNTENVLQAINQEYVFLNRQEVDEANKLLKGFLHRIIPEMRELDHLFKTLFTEIFYGGSYYDDLKVGNPDEFDIDFLLVLPGLCETHKSTNCKCVEVVPSDKPGYFWFKVDRKYFNDFNKLTRNGYVQADLVKSWFQSLVYKSLAPAGFYRCYDSSVSAPSRRYKFYSQSQSGPAITIRYIHTNGTKVNMDLVPSFKFGDAHWPGTPFRPNPSAEKTGFSLVPKMAKDAANAERYWRASFQEQEREMMNGKEHLKPALRLLKLLRFNLGHHSVFSYALKTIVLWEVDAGNIDFERSLNAIFLELLEEYRESLNNKKIPYYWNERMNLLDGINPETLTNHCNEISKKIDHFKRHCDTNPLEIARMLLDEDEYNSFRCK